MTHLTPPLEPWLEIIGLFLQLNRWHAVPGWMSASVNTHTISLNPSLYIFSSLPLICHWVKYQLSHNFRNIEAPPTYIQTETLSPLVPLKSLKIFPDRKKNEPVFHGRMRKAGYTVKSAHICCVKVIHQLSMYTLYIQLYPQEVSGLCEGTWVMGITDIMIMATCRTVMGRQLAWTCSPRRRPCVCCVCFWLALRFGC